MWFGISKHLVLIYNCSSHKKSNTQHLIHNYGDKRNQISSVFLGNKSKNCPHIGTYLYNYNGFHMAFFTSLRRRLQALSRNIGCWWGHVASSLFEISNKILRPQKGVLRPSVAYFSPFLLQGTNIWIGLLNST